MTDVEYELAQRGATAAGLDFAKYVRQLIAADVIAESGAATLERRAREAFERLHPKLPQIDPHDLHTILLTKLRAPKERRFFVRPHKRGYVF